MRCFVTAGFSYSGVCKIHAILQCVRPLCKANKQHIVTVVSLFASYMQGYEQ